MINPNYDQEFGEIIKREPVGWLGIIGIDPGPVPTSDTNLRCLSATMREELQGNNVVSARIEPETDNILVTFQAEASDRAQLVAEAIGALHGALPVAHLEGGEFVHMHILEQAALKQLGGNHLYSAEADASREAHAMLSDLRDLSEAINRL